ncbi:MAG: hypothetical protein ACTHYC_01960 [Sphingobacterium sp.]
MKITNIYILLITIFAIATLSSCKDTLDLDEDTMLLLEKQEKINKLDQLFDLSFKNALQAESDYRDFVKYELLTETQNYLDDSDVSWRNSRTNLAIRVNANFARVSAELPASMFDLYRLKFETNVLNRTLIGQSPQQLRYDERFAKFRERVEEIETFFDERANTFKANQSINSAIVNKNLILKNKLVSGALGNTGVYIINFDFTLKEDNGMDIEKFFFFPYIPKPNYSFLSQQDENAYSTNRLPSDDLLSPAMYVTYGNKIFFYFHLRNNTNPFVEGEGKIEREWIFEYEYAVNSNRLTLTKPRMALSMYPHLLTSQPGDEIYKNYYSDGLKEFILSIN